MGEDRRTARTDRDPTTNQQRLTVHDAARRLDISEDAVRMRVKRGTLPAEKEGGRLYVLLDIEPTSKQTTDRTDELLEELKDRVHRLEYQLDQEREARTEERRRQDTVIAQLSRANEEQARTIRQLEAPAESPPAERELPQTVEEEPERAPTRPSTGEAEVATEGRSETEPSLLWERVAVVILSILVYIAQLVVAGLAGVRGPWWGYVSVGTAVLAWIVIPAVFGFRLGRKSRSLRFWRSVAPVAALLGILNLVRVLGALWLAFFSVIPSFVYIFAAVLGNALRRRHREALVAERPSEFPQEAAAPAPGWTPRQQAIVGLSGTIISALIGLIGTIITVMASG